MILVTEKEKGHVVGGTALGIGSPAVGEVEQPLQVGKLPLLEEPVHILERRSEVGAAVALHRERFGKLVKLLPAVEHRVHLHCRIVLDDVQVGVLEEQVGLVQDGAGLRQEGGDDPFPAGVRRVDDDDQVVYLPSLLVLQRLHQRDVAIQLQPVGVEPVVEGVRVHLHLLPEGQKALQKSPVVVALPVLDL